MENCGFLDISCTGRTDEDTCATPTQRKHTDAQRQANMHKVRHTGKQAETRQAGAETRIGPLLGPWHIA